jgi:hypothetical protein
LQGEIDTNNTGINIIDIIRLQNRVTNLESQVAISTPAISDIKSAYYSKISGILLRLDRLRGEII